jgi:uridine kinase
MIQQIASFINNGVAKLVGVTGRAGCGKSTLSTGLGFPTYHIDSAFIGDSTFRKELMESKRKRSVESLQDMANQYNWWNWDLVEEGVKVLKKYSKPALVEGAILGPPAIINMLDAILLIEIPDDLREARIVARDVWKRSDQEIKDRLFLTNAYESKYYEWLLLFYGSKIYRIDEEYNFI